MAKAGGGRNSTVRIIPGQTIPLPGFEATRQRFPGDHAGQLETSEAMVICPEHVQMERLDDSLWYARPGKEATRELGEAALEAAADDIETLIFKGVK